ncbi:hypothetical protein LTR36_006863 [Oleoguttula mirabilis]|uniref:Histone H1 n=1 Tax=Oleoguttula mirabilis TaxID=1507867 RepID=A0AAV9JCB9_9PEZI|nr:hypothetical protein LTR36_006863 [Oleoguttula mirabilis]
MAPKKAATAGAKKTAAAPAHGSYLDMLKEAIINLKERNGSSRQALKKYVKANNELGSVTDAQFTSQFNRALLKGSESGVFARPKGTSGPVKLAGPTKPAAAAPAAKAAPATKAPAKAKTATTKAAAPKKSPAKKAAPAKKTATAKKAAPAKKATATKTKANTSKTRKTPAIAPAVEDKEPVVLGKTKSGRVTKSKAPQAVKKAATTTKRKAPAKKATPKKAATPKAKA